MQLLSKYKQGRIKYLLCAIDLFSKYGWVVPLKDKKGITIVNAFQKIISIVITLKRVHILTKENLLFLKICIRILKKKLFK